MVRFGFGSAAGALSVALVGWLSGCSQDAASQPETSQASLGGSAPTAETLEASVGRLLVFGESEAVGQFEKEFRGSSQPLPEAPDYVRCGSVGSDPGVRLQLEAGTSSIVMVSAALDLPHAGAQQNDALLGPFREDVVKVRTGETRTLFYEYERTAASQCRLDLTTFDDERVSGTLACRDLSASSLSLDAPSAGGSSGIPTPKLANATLQFDCPFKALSSPGSGGSSFGGNANVAGASGSDGKGGSGGAGGSGATAGSAGSSPAPKQCTGVNTPCSLRSSVTCEEGTGCTLDEHCSGFPPSCYGQFNVYSCTSLRGCFWSSGSQKCSGSASSCSSFAGPASCGGQLGCNWESDCTGSAPLCSTLSEGLCALEPDCHLQ